MKNQHQTWIMMGVVGLILVLLAVAGIVGMRAQLSGSEAIVQNELDQRTNASLVAQIDQGLRPETRQAIAKLFVPYQNQKIWNFDTEALQRQIEALPWIYNVEVSQRWPNEVIIHAQERVPIARWLPREYFPQDYQQLPQVLAKTKIWLMDDQSQIFRANALPRSNFMVVSGSDNDRKVILDGYTVVQNALLYGSSKTDGNFFTARALWQDQRGAWHLWLKNGTLVDLGRENLEARMVTLVRALPVIAVGHGGQMPRYVNLVYDKGLALRW